MKFAKTIVGLILLTVFSSFSLFADGIKVFRVAVNKLTETTFTVPGHISSVQPIYTESSTDGLLIIVSYTEGEVTVVKISDYINTFND